MGMELYSLVMPLMAGDGGDGGNSIGAVLGALRNALGTWGGYVVGILGVAALIVGLWNIVTGMISHGKKQTNWLISIALLLIGGVLMGWGIKSVQSLANKDDVNNILHGQEVGGKQGDEFTGWAQGDKPST